MERDMQKQKLQELLGGPERVALLLAQFKTEVSDVVDRADRALNGLDWFALSAGWAIAKGLTPELAVELASYIRYHTDLA